MQPPAVVLQGFTPLLSQYYRVQCARDDTNNDYLTMRIISPTCRIKSAVEDDILNIKKEVQDLKEKVNDILNLLGKPKTGKLIEEVNLLFSDFRFIRFVTGIV